MKPCWMNGALVSNLCQLLDSLSWVLDERIHIQELEGISEGDYTSMYKLYLSNKIDVSIFLDFSPTKLPQAPRRKRIRGIYISSYRSSLKSLKTVGYTVPQAGQGSTFKCYRLKKQIRTRGAPRIGTAESQLPRDQSPEI